MTKSKSESSCSGVSTLSDPSNTSDDASTIASTILMKKYSLGRSDHTAKSSDSQESQDTIGTRRNRRKRGNFLSNNCLGKDIESQTSVTKSNPDNIRLQAPEPPSCPDKEQSLYDNDDNDATKTSLQRSSAGIFPPGGGPGAIRVPGFNRGVDEETEADDSGTLYGTDDGLDTPGGPVIVAHLAQDRDEELKGIVQRLSSVLKYPIVVAQPIDDNNEKPKSLCGLSKPTFLVILAIFLTFIIGASIALGLVFSSKNDNNPIMVPTQSPAEVSNATFNIDSTDTSRFGPMVISNYDILNSHLSSDALHDPQSPQSKALKWIEDPNMSFSNLETEQPDIVLERFVMAVFYYSMSGPKWNSDVKFLSPSSICDWYKPIDSTIIGVICEGDSVTDIVLPNFGLEGNLPTELALLSNLRVLNLHDNSIMGRLPTDLATLSNLQELRLSRNLITGSLPTEFGQLTNLYEIYFGRNELTGAIPTELGLCTSLENLGLARNSFIGSIPSYIGNLKNLNHLDLDKNYFLTGTIPTEVGLLTNLNQISLEDNKFFGNLPDEISHLSLLKKFWVENNRFTGTVPESFIFLSSLIEVKLHGNLFVGNIDTTFCDKRTNQWQELTADCEVNIIDVPVVECSCCTKCF